MARGFIGGVVRGHLFGWAYDPTAPDLRLELDVKVDDKPVGSCVANLERADLAGQGVGDGHHAFRIKLAEPLEPGSEHVIEARVHHDGTVLPLSSNYVVRTEDGGAGVGITLRAVDRDIAGDTSPPQAWAPTVPDSRPRALAGARGWLFEVDELDNVRRLLGGRPCPPTQVLAWRDRLLENQSLADDLGVAYIVASVPPKVAVYEDLLPDSLALEPAGRAADQLSAALRDRDGIELLDLLPPLRHARSHGEVHLRAGSGWTWLGAFHAYRAIAKELAKRMPDLHPHPLEALELGDPVDSDDPLPTRERVTLIRGELLPVAIDPGEPPDTEPDLVRARLETLYVPLPEPVAGLAGPGASVLEHPSPPHGSKGLLVHDGAGGRLAPFLAEHFARTVVVESQALPGGLLRHEAPAVIVHVISEAGLAGSSPAS